MLDAENKLIANAIVVVHDYRKGPDVDAHLSQLAESVDAWINALPCSVDAPFAVRQAIVWKFLYDLNEARRVLKNLVKLFDYYGFDFAGMFHGVEPDGYIHT